MHAIPSSPMSSSIPFLRAVAIRTAAGVPPVPPEGSPPAGRSEGKGQLSGRTFRQRADVDVRRAVSDRVAAMLARGESVFRERWARAAAHGMPCNGHTGVPYRGVNVLLLLDALAAHGYVSNVWLTYRQAAGLGAQVRRGERAVLCAQFERGAGDGALSRGGLRCEPFWLFNVAQIEGLPPEVLARCATKEMPLSSCLPVERTLRLLCGCDARMRYGYEHVVYVPGADEIRMPWPATFASAQAHCAAVLRALVHWSGHASRMDRGFGHRVGDAAWAFEELVAELGSIFLMGHCSLPGTAMKGHTVACLDAWLRLLRSDPTAIFAAARHANEAFAFIAARAMPRLDPLESFGHG